MRGSGSGNGHRNLFLRDCVKGSERKFDGGAKKVGRLCCMCAFCLPTSLSASKFQGAGRQKPGFS